MEGREEESDGGNWTEATVICIPKGNTSEGQAARAATLTATEVTERAAKSRNGALM